METDPANLSRWESGKYIPTEDALKAIANAYGITPENFFGQEMNRALLLARIIETLPTLDNSELEEILADIESAPSRRVIRKAAID